jgi:hypothetical protein
MKRILTATVSSIGVLGGLNAQSLPNLFPFPNDAGILATYNAGGPIDLTGPFFASRRKKKKISSPFSTACSPRAAMLNPSLKARIDRWVRRYKAHRPGNDPGPEIE